VAKTEWVMDPLTGNMMQRGASPALHVVKVDVDTLARETGQNSRDQKIPGKKGPIEVRYTLIELSGRHKADFLNSMDWPGLKAHLEACANETGETGPRLRRGLDTIASSAPLRCLRVEDFATRGLQGGDFDRDKNFSLLCRAEFKTPNVGGRGGSYGLGKAVLWRFSGIATVLFSSIVQGWESKGVRVFGRTDIPSHSIPGDGEYQSGGWFGARRKRPSDSSQYAESVFGDSRLAKSLLLDRASSKSPGTSALIVGFYEPDQDEIRKLDTIGEDILASAERWFWPSMTGATPSMVVQVVVEQNGKTIFQKKTNPLPAWEPFIRARTAAATGATARSPGEVAENQSPFKVPARELPPAQAYREFDTTVKLRVTRADQSLESHEKANCVAVFRGAEMVVKYVASKRKPLDNQPFFAVLMAGTAVGTAGDDSRVEEFFRASEPPLHNDWEYTEAVKHTYKSGAKQRLASLWSALQEKVFALIDESVTPREQGPVLLARLFPFGQSQKAVSPKRTVKTNITRTTYLGGKWKVQGEIERAEGNAKPWKTRIGFVAATDSGFGEYLQIAKLTVNDKRAKVTDRGPPATVSVAGSIDGFAFEAILNPPVSLQGKDLDLTAIRFSH